MTQIIQAGASEQVKTLCEIFREDAASLDTDLCFQSFEKELAELPENYTAGGALYLAVEENTTVGCLGFRKLFDAVGELKRLYVRPPYRGQGVGRQLVLRAIQDARALGYETMRLDTLPSLQKAIALHRSLGFRAIPPYYRHPVPGAAFLELRLR